MKLTKKVETDVLKAYNTMWDAYLTGDLKTFASYLHEKLQLIGTAEHEIFHDKKSALNFYKRTSDQVTNVLQMRKRRIHLTAFADKVMINEYCHLYIFMNKKWSFYGPARLTTLFGQVNGHWMNFHQHGSLPDVRTAAGQQLPTEKLKKENLQLKQAVQRRTIELEEKNNELKIEAALERVRSVALGMREPSDMLAICKTIARQLHTLGVKEIRNVQTAIFDKDDNKYMNYEFYVKHDKTIITKTNFANNKIHRAFATKMLKGKGEFFVTHIKGQKVKEWVAYQKTTNVFIDKFLNKASSLNYYWYSLGPVALGISTYNPLSRDEQGLFKRFLNVFELAYARYLDIEKAEAQAREAQVEASLERVRSRTMAMHQSDELKETAELLYKELTKLGILKFTCGYVLLEENSKIGHSYMANPEGSFLFEPLRIDHSANYVFKTIYSGWKKKEVSTTIKLSGQKNIEHNRYLAEEVENFPLTAEQILSILPDTTYSNAFHFKYGYLLVVGLSPFTAEHVEIIARFTKVFEQTYTRFLDLKKAEAQTREAQIEAALERVRSRTNAMHHSENLHDVIKEIYRQLRRLNFRFDGADFLTDYRDGYTVWLATDQESMPLNIRVPSFDHRIFRLLNKAIKKKDKFFSFILTREEKDIYFNHLIETSTAKHAPELHKKALLEAQGMAASCVVLKNIILSVTNFASVPYTEAENEIIKRFAYVFEQSYTRFQDLQKAEAQAREAQIEAALERVRSKAMAMQKSNEFLETAAILFNQINQLGENIERTIIGVINEDERVIDFWATRPDGSEMEKMQKMPIDEPIVIHKVYVAWKQKQKSIIIDLRGEELESYFQFLKARSPRLTRKSFGERRVESFAFFSKGFVGVISAAPNSPVNIGLYERFAAVFDQTYTRFLDLQKAEVQAREARIEAALERVRSKAMAMHKSEDIQPAISIVFEEMEKLNLGLLRCGIGILDRKTHTGDVWTTHQSETGSKVQVSGNESLDIHPLLKGAFKAWVNQADFSYVLKGKDLVNYYEAVSKTDFHLPPSQLVLKADKDYTQFYYVTSFEAGTLFAFREAEFPEEAKAVMKRFANVFALTYKRFLDIRNAEEQAREAQVQLALERVRARTMAMHTSEELLDIISVVSEQLQQLGIKFNNVSFGVNSPAYDMQLWMAIKGFPGAYEIKWTFIDNPGVTRLKEAQKNPEKVYTDVLTQEENKEWLQHIFHCNANLAIFSEQALDQLLNTAGFARSIAIMKDIFLVMGNYAAVPYSEEENAILKRFANVFEQTYTRFLDLQKAEAQAREAQIETALEKVRSRSMGMQKSEELKDVIKIVYDQLSHLRIKLDHAGFVVDYTPHGDWHFWITDEQYIPSKITHPYFESIWASQFNEAKEKGARSFVTNLDFEEKNKFYNELLSYVPGLPETSRRFYLNCPGLAISTVLNDDVSLYIENFEGIPYTEEENNILMRFGKVFQQTYTRFLDLQKAEAQAKEARIESSLERVRGKAMAMHSTQDLSDTIHLFYRELQTFSLTPRRCGVGLLNKESRTGELFTWNTTEKGESLELVGLLKMEGHPILQQVYENWLSQTEYRPVIRGNEIRDYYKVIRPQMNFPDYDKDEVQYGYFFFFSEGGVYAWTGEEMKEDELKIYRRFTSVLSLTYKRYKDLQLAEAHARQAEQDLMEIKTARQKAEQALTELQSTQKQLIQSEKMASLGELTAGIAHEIQNPLNFVNNFSEVSNELIDEMLDAVKRGDQAEAKAIAADVKQNLEKISRHGKRADGIVKGMLQHSRTSTGQKEPTDINALADEYLRLAYHGLRAKDKRFNAKFETILDPALGMVNVVPQEIGRVILNLINNAFYAVSEKKKTKDNGYEPTVIVSTRRLVDKIEIRVSDNGNGIPKKNLDKIFQPFFTTKHTGQGTGLGLSLSYDIITKGHGGELKVETREREGTTFIILLPV